MARPDPRAIAARQLANTIGRGHAYNPALDSSGQLDKRDRGLIKEIGFGTLRHYHLLAPVVNAYLKKPFAKKDSDVYALLLAGLYQMRYMGTPAHAAINTAVDATRALKKSWAKGLVNAVLRNLVKDNAHDMAAAQFKASLSEANLHSHPDWLYRKIQRDWPEHAGQIITYNNSHPPMTLRVDDRQIKAEEYITLLNERSISASRNSLCSTAITLDKPVGIASLPLFEQGAVSVQDAGAQLAAELLDLSEGCSLLDACAAPGGKSIHALQHCPDLQVTALDHLAERLDKLSADLQRCSLFAKVVVADASEAGQWWDGNRYDRILLDAPCSGSGIISHHPDIKLLRKPDDLAGFAAQQIALLRALWPLLEAGGKLLYCTCSIMPEENSAVIEQFLAQCGDAQIELLSAPGLVDPGCGHQLLPKAGQNGGFFYARLSKKVKSE